VLTDPPYNISSDFEAKFPDRGSISHDFGDWDDGSIQPKDWVPEAERVLTDNGVLIAFYDNRNIHQLISAVHEAGLELRQKLYWHKKNPVPQLYGVKWQEAVEEAVIATKNRGDGHHFIDRHGQRHNVIQTPICSNSEREGHPTQKPEELFRTIIKWWSQPGDKVLDPFMGTGTTCVTAKQLDRHYIGIEQQQEHVETAHTRLQQTNLHRYGE
jgi:DNA modification methylase